MESLSFSNHLSKTLRRWDLLAVFVLYFFVFDFFGQGRWYGASVLLSLLVKPLALSFVLRRLLEDLRPQAAAAGKGCAWKNFLPFLGIELTLRVFIIVFFVLLTAVLAAAFPVMRNEVAHFYVIGAAASLVLALEFFWYAARGSVAGDFWGSFRQAIVGIRGHAAVYAWAAYLLFIETAGTQSPAQIQQDRPLLAVLGTSVLFGGLFLFTYRVIMAAALQRAGLSAEEMPEGKPQEGSAAAAPATELAKDGRAATTSLVLGLLSLIPLVHLGALILGYKIFFKQKVGRVRSLIGFLLGAFFTAMYVLLAIGLMTLPEKKELVHIATLDRLAEGSDTAAVLRAAAQAIREKDLFKAQALLEGAGVPDDEGRAFALGIVHTQLGYPEEAIESFKKCLAFPGHNGEAYYHLAVLTMGSPETGGEAAGYLEEFLKRFPGDRAALAKQRLLQSSIPWEGNIALRLTLILILMFSFTIHEFCHAYAAYRCGDDTQKESGRLSFNPLRHMDPIGSVLLPGILLLRNSNIVFGWARPVMVDRSRFRSPEKDDIFVSVAGPLSNFAAAIAATTLLLVIGLLLTRLAPQAQLLNFLAPFSATSVTGVAFARFWAATAMVLKELIVLSLVLCFFNLLPIPPLDGSWILENILPASMRPAYARLRQYSFVFILILVLTPILSIILGIPLSLFLGFSVGIVGAAIGLV